MSSIRTLPLLLVLALAGCAAAPGRAPAPAPATPAHDNLNATAWMQTSIEYTATALQAFRQACDALDGLIAEASATALLPVERSHGFETRPPAVIADIDETLLDNSPYQARQVIVDAGFDPASWSAWVDERGAAAIPGAVAFAECVQGKGATLIYLSNRTHEQREATIDNLRAAGFPLPQQAEAVVLLRGDPRAPQREKGPRREWVGDRYRVVAMLGDNLGDFIDDIDGTPAQRAAAVAPQSDWWGRRWFMLPNPSYGSWESALTVGCAQADADARACTRAALRRR